MEITLSKHLGFNYWIKVLSLSVTHNELSNSYNTFYLAISLMKSWFAKRLLSISWNESCKNDNTLKFFISEIKGKHNLKFLKVIH